MTKEIKAFVTRDDFVSNTSIPSPIYELSPIAGTYSKYKKEYYSTINPIYTLHTFNQTIDETLETSEVNNILKVVEAFSRFLGMTMAGTKAQVISVFINDYNSKEALYPVSALTYNSVAEHLGVRVPDYVSFKVHNVTCSIWLVDEVFRAFYPAYEIDVVYPFDKFATSLNSPTIFVNLLETFDYVAFNRRLEDSKLSIPNTITRIMNIQYKVPNTSVMRNCYFGFIIYGGQGNYDHLLKLALHEKLVALIKDQKYDVDVETLFPTILMINEFFMIPRWDRMAIISQVGQSSIGSQVTKAYSETFDITKFVKVYNNDAHVKNNTYNVPVDYNNLLLHIVNGMYSEESVKNFDEYYRDLLTVNSFNPDFSRMKPRTQKFIVMLETLINVCDAADSVELFNKVMSVTSYHLSIITRNNIVYVSLNFEDHQYYMIPRYELVNNNK